MWKTLMESVFPDAPAPPNWTPGLGGVGYWRFWFKEMCQRTERYERARVRHERVAAESSAAQLDLHKAWEVWQDDLKRVRRQWAIGNDAALPDENLPLRWRVQRRIANEKKASEETALITMNEEREFLTKWDPFAPVDL